MNTKWIGMLSLTLITAGSLIAPVSRAQTQTSGKVYDVSASDSITHATCRIYLPTAVRLPREIEGERQFKTWGPKVLDLARKKGFDPVEASPDDLNKFVKSGDMTATVGFSMDVSRVGGTTQVQYAGTLNLILVGAPDSLQMHSSTAGPVRYTPAGSAQTVNLGLDRAIEDLFAELPTCEVN